MKNTFTPSAFFKAVVNAQVGGTFVEDMNFLAFEATLVSGLSVEFGDRLKDILCQRMSVVNSFSEDEYLERAAALLCLRSFILAMQDQYKVNLDGEIVEDPRACRTLRPIFN